VRQRLALIAALGIALPSCHACRRGMERRETLAQVSTIDALLAGDYDGKRPCHDLLRFGGFGIGTFHGLDGEMIVLDGTFYKVDITGKVHVMPKETKTPFACVTSFEPDVAIPVPAGLDFDGLCKRIDAKAGGKNLFLAVRVEGTFHYVQTRSVPRQTKPYPPLADVVKQQKTFEFRDVRGTIVGFRCPVYVKGVNVPGYHLHFLTDDRRGGGHILGLTVGEAVATVDVTPNFYLMLPTAGAFAQLDLTKDREKELHNVEK